jgi:hypothetical protein
VLAACVAGLAAWPLVGDAGAARLDFGTPLVSQAGAGTRTSGSSSTDFFPNQIAVADLNRDGLLDVVSELPIGDLLVHLGLGDGRLASPQVLSTPGGSWGAQAADLDGDGALDIVWAGYAGSGVFFGDGTGAHWTHMPLPCSGAQRVAIADFDGDGMLDCAILAWDIVTFLSRPSRTYQTVTQSRPPQYSADRSSLRIADLNSDGRVDILQSGPFGLSTFLSHGDGTYEIAFRDDVWGRMDVADVDGDGRPDVVVLDRYSLKLLRGRGDGTFDPPQSILPNLDIRAQEIAVADLDGDHLPDLLIADLDGRLLTRLGTGGGSFASPSVMTIGQRLAPMALADVDRDERLDVIAMSDGASALFVGLGDGAGGLVQHPSSVGVAVTLTGEALAGDLDGDGAPDLVMRTASPQTSLGALLARPGRVFQTVPFAPVADLGAFRFVRDFTQDGHLDLLVDLTGGRFAVLPGNGDGTFQSPIVTLGGLNTRAVVGDATGDGVLDLVSIGSSTVLLMAGRGDGTFEPPVGSTMPYAVSSVALGELNGDGIPDVDVGVSYSYGWSTVSGILTAFGTPSRVFVAQPMSLNSGADQWFVEIADLDGDGRDDIVAKRQGSEFSNELWTALQVPNGSMGPWVQSWWPSGWWFSDLLDVDRDGNLDAIATWTGFFVSRGDGTGRFQTTAGFHAPATIHGAADFDLDGRLDLFGVDPLRPDSVSFFYGRDGLPPNAALIAPAGGARLGIGQSVVVGWQVEDAEDLAGTEVHVSRHGPNGPFDPVCARGPGVTSCEWTATGPASDSVAFKVVARDFAGNAGVAIGALVAIADLASVELDAPSIARISRLSPNPASTNLAVTVVNPEEGRVRLTLHDLQGRRVTTLLDDVLPAGESTKRWPRSLLARAQAGLYFVRLSTSHGQDIERVILVR